MNNFIRCGDDNIPCINRQFDLCGKHSSIEGKNKNKLPSLPWLSYCENAFVEATLSRGTGVQYASCVIFDAMEPSPNVAIALSTRHIAHMAIRK
ncbi:hypothetical protein IF2G_10610 [Cordyceps javanica]|nr:hypothetical protein IF2G_10610 [Cordyceps javanica]